MAAPKITIYNPLPVALRHYEEELASVLGAAFEVQVVRVATEQLSGFPKLRALARHLATSRRLARSPQQVVVTWPMLGWYELLVLGSGSATAVVVHDPQPLRAQIGLGPRAARIARRFARRGPVVLNHSSLAERDTLRAIPAATTRVVPHPSLPTATVDPATRDRRRVAVLGQHKDARDMRLLEELGARLAGAGYEAVIRGRGWPAVHGWQVEDRFLSEAELDAELDRAGAVLLPYAQYYQSGIAIRALERGTPVVGERHSFLEAVFGVDYAGLVDTDTPDGWVDVIRAVTDRGPGETLTAPETDRGWAEVLGEWRETAQAGAA